MIAVEKIPVTEFSQSNTVRLICTAYIDEPAIAPLAENAEALDFLEGLEELTSAARSQSVVLPIGVAENELLTERHGNGWTYVNAAFCYTSDSGNRFNGADRGSWYAAWGDDRVACAQAEVAWHLTQELDAIGQYDNLTSYCELLSSFNCDMHDLRGFSGQAILDADPKIAYPESQALAASLRANGSNGVLFPSVRYPKGECLAAFRLNLMQNISYGDRWDFVWSGERRPDIRLQPSD